MEANELRIGNLVHLDLGLPHLSVHAIMALDFYAINETISIIHPIPLTEEWLLKFGFKKEVHSSISSSSTWLYLPDFPLRKSGGFANPMYFSLGTYDGIKIYSVHQLQNLYYALTGDELCIKQ